MKKYISMILAILAICLFAGCVSEQAKPADAGTQQESAPAAATDTVSDKDVSDQLNGLNDCLQNIRETVQPGTAGGSLRAYAAAARLMDWGVACKLDAAQIAAQYDNFTVNLSADEKEEFAMQLDSVRGAYLQLLTEGQEGYLSDAGVEDCGYPYGSDPIPAAEALFSAAGIE